MELKSQLKKIADAIFESLPEAVKEANVDLKQQITKNITEHLRQLDLVTREEFDIQLELLARTRTRLETLEKKITALENAPRDDESR